MKNDSLPLNQYKTIKHFVYEQLRSLIVTGQYPPRYRLITGNIAEQMGVSLTPVREALHRLEAEGLVSINLYHGSEVAELSVDEIIEIYQIRAGLEAMVTRLAAPNMTQEDLAQMGSLVQEMDQAAQEKKLGRVIEINREFHSIIWKASKSRRLRDLLENYYDASQRFRYASVSVPENLELMCMEHKQIYQSLLERNIEQAARYAGDHLERTASYLLASLKSPNIT